MAASPRFFHPECLTRSVAAPRSGSGSSVEFGKEFYHKVLRPRLTKAICGKAKFRKYRKLYDTATKVAGMVAEASIEVDRMSNSSFSVEPWEAFHNSSTRRSAVS